MVRRYMVYIHELGRPLPHSAHARAELSFHCSNTVLILAYSDNFRGRDTSSREATLLEMYSPPVRIDLPPF